MSLKVPKTLQISLLQLEQKVENGQFHFSFNSSSALLRRAKLEKWKVRIEFSLMVVNPIRRVYGRVKIIKAKGSYYGDAVSFDFILRLHFKDNTKWNAKCNGGKHVIFQMSLESSILWSYHQQPGINQIESLSEGLQLL